MEHIAFRCSTCDHLLKVNPERAGRKVKCTRCNALLTVPQAKEDDDEAIAPAKAAPAPAPKPSNDEDDRGDGTGYGLLINPQEEAEKRRRAEEERKAKRKKKDEPKAIIKKRVKTIYDVEQWKVVRVGLVIALSALAFWGLQFLLHEITVLVGVIAGPQYGTLVDVVLFEPIEDPENWPKVGRMMPIDRMGFAMSLVSGHGFRTLGKVFFILGEAFLLVMGGMFLTAYFYFREVPDRFGSKGQAKALIIIGIINLTFGLFCRLLPMSTNFGPSLIPLTLPEVAMTEANTERLMPLHVFWMHTPFWETLLSLIVQLVFWTEPILIAVFVWTCGKILQEDQIEEQAHGLSMLAGGVYFIAFAYIMVSLAGTSAVLLSVLKVVYILYLGFFIGYIIRFAVVLNNARAILDQLIEDSEAAERKSGKKKKSGKLFRDEDEEEDYDEDEEDDDDYDDDDDRDYDDDEDEDEDERRR